MYSFLALAGPAACLIFGAKGAKDANLPITVGPQKEPVKGPATASKRAPRRSQRARARRARRTEGAKGAKAG